jgi:Predicted transcriptional regulators
MAEKIIHIPLKSIVVDNNNNPRKEMENAKQKIEYLAENIEEATLLQPITVEDMGDGRYKLVTGHRRCQAYELLHKKHQDEEGYDNKYSSILAMVRENVKDKLFVALSENMARKNMTKEELARAIYAFKEATKDTVREIAYKLGYGKTYIDDLYQFGKALENPQNPIPGGKDETKNSFNPEQVPSLMETANITIDSIKHVSALDAKEKIALREKSKEVIRELQNMIAYLRESEKKISQYDDVRELLKEQKELNKRLENPKFTVKSKGFKG